MDGCTPLVLKVRKKVIENGNRKEEATTRIRIFRDWIEKEPGGKECLLLL